MADQGEHRARRMWRAVEPEQEWAAVGDARAERLVGLVAPVVAAIAQGDGFMPGNPMGLRLLSPPG
ncbi:MAG: hypothetical protein L0I24_08910 [Pseudonocardia sp.]|nr:hypothetical protein [Pseudonocardia sp.]